VSFSIIMHPSRTLRPRVWIGVHVSVHKDDYPNEPESRGIRPLETPKNNDGGRLTPEDEEDTKAEDGGASPFSSDDSNTVPLGDKDFIEKSGWKRIDSCSAPEKHRLKKADRYGRGSMVGGLA
jgi:hypothetical protein